MKKIILSSAVIMVLLSSCTTFNRKMIKNDPSVIKKENAFNIDGRYEFKGYEHIDAANKKSEEAGDVARMFDIKNINVENCDQLVIKSVPMEKKNTYELQFTFLKEDKTKYSFKYSAVLKNDFFILDNYTSFCHGIPYLFGGCRSFQSRVGLTRDHHLVIQDYYDNSGAALFVMGAGYTINYAEKYKRISNE